MKIAILSPYETVAPHFETELEIAQKHVEMGDDVEIVSCFGELTNCEYNPNKDSGKCQACVNRRSNGLLRLQPAPKTSEIKPPEPSPHLENKTFLSVDELKTFQVDGFDIGYAVLSSLVSITRNPDPDFTSHRELIQKLMISAWECYEFTLQFLAEKNPDRVYIFNGRFANMRAVLRACQFHGTDCYVHERGCDMQHYDLFPNHLPHDIDKIQTRINETWENAEATSQREAIGSSWFEERIARIEKSWHSFVKNQEPGRLPENFDAAQKNIAIFTSSDDEFVSIGDQWNNPLYESQLDGIQRILTDLAKSAPEIQVYLRVHPNLKNVENSRKRETLNLSFPNLTIIPPEAPLDSYALIKNADQVVTFGSSVGIEAVYWGTPSVLLGPCFYKSLGGTWQPETHQQAIDLLTDDLKPGKKTGALKYGYWLQTRGIPFQYFEATGLFEGKFKGSTITAEPPKQRRTVLQKVKHESRRVWQQLTGMNS